MIEKYGQICYLLEELGNFDARFNEIEKIIQSPNFRYEKKDFPEILEDTFLRSSYWLRTELFDESYLYQTEPSQLQGEQHAHIRMLDVGATLIDKGFPLEYHPEQYQKKGPDVLAPYVKAFSEQCHKRHDFLTAKPVSHKKTTIQHPKTAERE